MVSVFDSFGSVFAAFGAFLVVLGPIVIIHESGHYLMAKLFKAKVLVFSIGFGKRLWGFTRGGTDYRISVLPLGGYVRLGGEYIDETSGDPSDVVNKPRWQRILIYLAGPAMNLIFSVVLFTALYMLGISLMIFHQAESVVGFVDPGSPAAQAGFQLGDEVLAVDGKPTPLFRDLAFEISTGVGRPLAVDIERDGRKERLTVTPVKDPETGDGDIGLRPRLALVVADVLAGTPAQGAGLRAGDVLSRANGKGIGGSDDFLEMVRSSRDRPLVLEVLREGQPVELTMTPRLADVVVEVPVAGAAPPADKYLLRIAPTPPEDPRNGMVVAQLESRQAAAAIQVGETLRAVDGQPVPGPAELLAALESKKGQVATLTVEGSAGARQIDIPIGTVRGRSQIGMTFTGYSRKLPFGEALAASWALNMDVVKKTVQILEMLFKRLINPQDVLSGPLGIADFSFEAWQRGPDYVFYLIAILSVNIGLMNMLPIPLLDGGHITTLTVESILRRDLPLAVKERLAQVGFMLLVMLMAVAFIFDLLRQLPDDTPPAKPPAATRPN